MSQAAPTATPGAPRGVSATAIGLVALFAELRTLIDRRTLKDADLEMLGYLIGTWATYTHLRDTGDAAALRAFDAAIREALEAPTAMRRIVPGECD